MLPLSVPDAGLTAPTSEPLVEVNGEKIMAAGIEQAQLQRLGQQIYEATEARGVIGQRLLALEAAKQGLSVQGLLDTEVTAEAGTMTEEKIKRFTRPTKPN